MSFPNQLIMAIPYRYVCRLTQRRQSLMDTPSHVILGCIKLTVKALHHRRHDAKEDPQSKEATEHNRRLTLVED